MASAPVQNQAVRQQSKGQHDTAAAIGDNSQPTALAEQPRAQLWSLVREISARLANIPRSSNLHPFAEKLRRLKKLNERCTKYEAQLKYEWCICWSFLLLVAWLCF
eukprot:INCI8310.3.p1 GENE.INCI8310.3~~INCI8310.3.p1  ORF type:complete len:106 (-),score=17.05 INCI8310.3:308-625(-)